MAFQGNAIERLPTEVDLVLVDQQSAHKGADNEGKHQKDGLDQDIILVLVMMIALQAQTNGR